MKKILTGLLLLGAVLLGSGCATVKGLGEDLKTVLPSASQPARPSLGASAPAAASAAHVDCEQTPQFGCWDQRVLVFQWDPTHPLMKGLDQHPATTTERQHRAQDLGPALWEAYRQGTVKAAAPKVVYYLFWNVNDVPVGNVAAFRVNGKRDHPDKHVKTRTTFEEVTSGPYMSAVSSLGRPHKVYRVRTDGPDAVGVSLVLPKSFFRKGQTHILRCMEGGQVVYPPSSNGRNPDGLWDTPTSNDWLMQNGTPLVRGDHGSSRVLSAFITAN